METSYDTHSASASAGRRLEHDGISAFVRESQRGLRVRNRLGISGNRRYSHGLRDDLGLDFVAKAVHHMVFRPDENDARGFTGSGKLCVLREETVSRMNRFYALCPGKLDDLINREISVHGGFAASDLIGFVRFCPEQCIFILFRAKSAEFQGLTE